MAPSHTSPWRPRWRPHAGRHTSGVGRRLHRLQSLHLPPPQPLSPPPSETGGQVVSAPLQRPISTPSHTCPDGLSPIPVSKTTSVTTSTLSTTSEVVWGPPILCHCAKLCVSSPCVFLGLFSFKEGAHD